MKVDKEEQGAQTKANEAEVGAKNDAAKKAKAGEEESKVDADADKAAASANMDKTKKQ
jgi:hypothetical protein